MTVTSACPECGTELAAGVRFCPECGARRPEEAPSSEVRKLVTVLFADVTGSTALGEQLDPEALRALMTRYFVVMRGIIERHGGTVEKFIGDAVMAVFGIPTVHEDDALRAVRAAWEIRAALARMNTRLDAERGLSIRFRTGVNTGEVVAGDPETGTTLVTGDPVNTAARLEQAAPPGEILLGRLTYSLVRDAVDAEPVEPIAAKGKAEPLEAWRLAAVHAGAAGRARHLDAPLVGRDVELARLDDAWRRAVDERTPHLVTLVAPAGVGKSRLVREFIANVREDGGRALVGRCLSYGQGITYWPVRELVHQAAGISEADTLSSARGRLDAVAPDPQTGARVASAIGLSQESAPQEELFLAIRRLLEHLAADQPTLVVLEDLHWAEDTFLDLVDQLVDLAAEVPLLLLATTRPELSERRPEAMTEREVRSVIRLESLGTEATAFLLAALPGGSAVPPMLRDRILDAAEGNPLYVEELLGLLRDEGTLRDAGDGTWSVAEGSAKVAMPVTIAALLTARLEALPADERGVAQRASVIGRSFEVAALAELDPAAPALSRHLLALVRKELLKPDRAELTAGDAFRFRHVLIRDAAYEALPKAGRAALHERFADWLERAAGDRLLELEEILGFHLEQAWRYRGELGEGGPHVGALAARASSSYRAAGMRADLRGDAASTIALLGRALEIQPDAGDDNERARLALAEALIGVAREPEAKTLLDGLQERAHLRGDVVTEGRAVMLSLLARAGMQDPPLRTPETSSSSTRPGPSSSAPGTILPSPGTGTTGRPWSGTRVIGGRRWTPAATPSRMPSGPGAAGSSDTSGSRSPPRGSRATIRSTMPSPRSRRCCGTRPSTSRSRQTSCRAAASRWPCSTGRRRAVWRWTRRGS